MTLEILEAAVLVQATAARELARRLDDPEAMEVFGDLVEHAPDDLVRRSAAEALAEVAAAPDGRGVIGAAARRFQATGRLGAAALALGVLTGGAARSLS